ASSCGTGRAAAQADRHRGAETVSDRVPQAGSRRGLRSRWLMRTLQAALVVLLSWLVWRSLAPELARVTLDDFLQWRPAIAPLLLSFALLVAMYSAHAL